MKMFREVPAAPRGPGDDAAVLPKPGTGSTCVTTDAVVEGVHFRRPAFSLEDVGHKALAVNLSDLAAMGAKPTWALCSLGLPAGFSVSGLQSLGRGMAALAKAHGVVLIGGNVTSSPVLSVTMTVAGDARKPLLRSGARAGDRVYVSGCLGLASAGLQVIERGVSGFERLRMAQKRPAPHIAWALRAAPYVSAAIDVSDGLIQDLGHVAKASKAAIALHTSAMVIDAALARFSSQPLEHVLSGGEDYVVAVTVPAARAGAFERSMAKRGFEVHRIGEVVRGTGVTVDGRRVAGRKGFQHALG